MSDSHEHKRRSPRVSEAAPVQVFLVQSDRARLDRLTNQLGTSKSDVLRQSLAALERELLDPHTHPALRLIGIVDDDEGSAEDGDIARHHDRYLADRHLASRDTAASESADEPTPPRSRSRRRRAQS